MSRRVLISVTYSLTLQLSLCLPFEKNKNIFADETNHYRKTNKKVLMTFFIIHPNGLGHIELKGNGTATFA